MKEIQAKCPLFARHKYKNFAQTFRRLANDYQADKEARGRRREQGLASDGDESSDEDDDDVEDDNMDEDGEDYDDDGGDGLYTRGDDDDKKPSE